MVGQASSRNKFLIATCAFVLVALQVFPLIASALTESAPSLIWSKTFSASDTVNATAFDGLTLSPTCNDTPGRFLVDLDWLSGDVVVAYNEDPADTANEVVVVKRLSQATGGTVWETTLGQSGWKFFACSLSLDQRGRVYVVMSSALTSNPSTVQGRNVSVLNRLTGDLIMNLDASIGGHGNYCGPIVVDVLSNVSDAHPMAAVSCGTSTNQRENWVFDAATATSYSNVCFTTQGDMGPIGWRLDGQGPALWTVRGSDGITRVNVNSCGYQGDIGTDVDTAHRPHSSIWWGATATNATMDWFARDQSSSLLWRRLRINAEDTTDPLTVNESKTIGLAGLWDSVGATVGQEVYQYEMADDGHALVCGRFQGVGPGTRDFFGRVDGDLQNWAWGINFTAASQRNILGCRLGKAGDVYVYGNEAGSPLEGYIRRYCCIDGKARTQTTEQALFEGEDEEEPPTGDIGEGFVVFFEGIGCGTEASKFFCGLVLVVVGMVSTGAAFMSTTKSRMLVFAASGLIGLALMVFLVFIDIWPMGAVVLLIILAGGITAFVVRRSFLGSG